MLGPLEIIIMEFKGNRFKGEVVPALQEIIDRGIIRIIDLAFVKKDASGEVAAFELFELDSEEAALFDPLAKGIQGLLSDEDIMLAAEALENNCSAALMLFEHTWATNLKAAILNANGRVVLDGRIPPEVVNEVIRESTAVPA